MVYTEQKESFLARQFNSKNTLYQRVFDGSFGVIVPAICFWIDPIVFGTSEADSLLPQYTTFTYVLAAISITALSVCLILGKRTKPVAGFLALLFYFGSAISLLLGIILAPFSFGGLWFFIGALGFTPFVSAFVYFRNGIRSARLAGVVYG